MKKSVSLYKFIKNIYIYTKHLSNDSFKSRKKSCTMYRAIVAFLDINGINF